jgi:hypothetical protein
MPIVTPSITDEPLPYASHHIPSPVRAIQCREPTGSWFVIAIFATQSDAEALFERLEQDANDPYFYQMIVL